MTDYCFACWKMTDAGLITLPRNQSFDSSNPHIEEYNQELDKFFREYPDSIKRQIAFENQHSRTIKLDIFLANTGTAPGEDIDIFMHFPDGLTLVDELPDSPAELLPPEKPKTLLEKVQGIRVSPAFFGLRSTHFPEFSQPPSNVSPPTIRRTNSYEVEVSVGNIKHGLREQLNPLFVIFDSYDTTTSFQIDYRILAANIPHEIREKLHVVVNKQYTQC